jgi:hypothetical protein
LTGRLRARYLPAPAFIRSYPVLPISKNRIPNTL